MPTDTLHSYCLDVVSNCIAIFLYGVQNPAPKLTKHRQKSYDCVNNSHNKVVHALEYIPLHAMANSDYALHDEDDNMHE